MKDNEIEYLDKLFASSSDVNNEVDIEYPLLDVPDGLNRKLHAITEPSLVSTATVKRGFFERWPKVTSIAASLLVTVVGFQFYQQQQTLKQLEHAQNDLATALHYLGEANRITRAQVLNSLNNNINKAGVVPAMEIELNDRLEPKKLPEKRTKTPTRSL